MASNTITSGLPLVSDLKIETSGMDEHFESTVVKAAIQLQKENFSTQD
jgi:hypothetical protein